MGYDNLFFPSAFLVVGAGLALALGALEVVWGFAGGKGKGRTSEAEDFSPRKVSSVLSDGRRLAFGIENYG